MRHVIKKQILEIRLAEGGEMFALQQQISSYYYAHILPSLEKVFDSLSDEESLLVIDRLEIDLGIVQWGKDVDSFEIDDLLYRLRQSAGTVCGQPGVQFLLQEDRKIPVTKRSISASACEQWLYYMNTGILPWELPATSDEWRQQVAAAFATDYQLVSRLSAMISGNRSGLERMIREHTIAFLATIAEIITARDQRALTGLTEETFCLFYPDVVVSGLPERKPLHKEEIRLWSKIFDVAIRGNHLPAQLVQAAIKDELLAGNMVLSSVRFFQDDYPLLKPVLEELLLVLPADIFDKQSPGDNVVDDGMPDLIDGPLLKDQLNKKGPSEELLRDDKKTENTSDVSMRAEPAAHDEDSDVLRAFTDSNETLLDDGIYVHHAGLILLHPFYRFLFAHRGLLHNGRFVSNPAQQKAVSLLRYLAVGDMDGEEHLLAVPKILCGWPVSEVIDSATPLTAEDLIECNDLLNAVIAQWNILKNTSIDGLREGFLQRPGKIYRKNDQAHFLVESSAIDILLDHLPWNLSLVKLPWLDGLIHVEWR